MLLQGLLLLIGMTALPARSDDFAIRRSDSALARNAQDRQFARDQAQLVQGLLRLEESSTLNRQSYIRLLPRSGADLAPREHSVRSTRSEQLQDELERISARSRHLEEQGKRLEQRRASRAHLRSQDHDRP